ncbi:MAG TPA: FkbM family methyltransferase [Pyrinomonadaceae bacterium]|nr:FkbM family methyltransferase [Pyrinomonadaceae bacterium]
MNVLKTYKHGRILYDRNDIWIGKSLAYYGEYSEAEVRLFEVLVQPRAVVFDIGANIGVLTIPLARFVGPRGLVVAIEPERMNYYTLCANVALNNLPWVSCLRCCVSDETGIMVVPDLDRNTRQNFGGLELDRPLRNLSGQPIPVIRLDQFDLAASLKLIKIDVEGMERRVLRGAAKIIKKYRPFLYVENDRDEKSQSLMNYIASLGYHMWDHLPPFWNPKNFAKRKKNIFGNLVSRNLFCHPDDQVLPFDPAMFDLLPV